MKRKIELENETKNKWKIKISGYDRERVLVYGYDLKNESETIAKKK